ncbi:MAG: aminotransferase class V-fold PLP-dependent enzyme, partial [Candidatus Hydrogenedentota bacterium]
MSERIYNFSAGPAAMPEPVLEQARDEMLDYRGSGMSVMEMSHRSSEFSEIIETTEADLREIFGVSDDYAVLFLQGGASTQFAMIPMNLAPDRASVDLVQTGSWTKKAAIEIEKIARLRIAGSSEKEKFRRIPPLDTLDLDPNAAYVHI